MSDVFLWNKKKVFTVIVLCIHVQYCIDNSIGVTLCTTLEVRDHKIGCSRIDGCVFQKKMCWSSIRYFSETKFSLLIRLCINKVCSFSDQDFFPFLFIAVRNWIWKNGNLYQVRKAWRGTYSVLLKWLLLWWQCLHKFYINVDWKSPCPSNIRWIYLFSKPNIFSTCTSVAAT